MPFASRDCHFSWAADCRVSRAQVQCAEHRGELRHLTARRPNCCVRYPAGRTARQRGLHRANDQAAALHAHHHPRRDAQEPRRHRPDGHLFGRRRHRAGLPFRALGPLRARRSRLRIRRSHRRDRPGPHHQWRSRDMVGRAHPAPEAHHRVHEGAEGRARHPARALGPQGLHAAALVRQRPADAGGPRARREDVGHRRTDGGADGRGPYRAAPAHGCRSRGAQGSLGGCGQACAGSRLRDPRDPQRPRLSDAHVPVAAGEQAQRRLRRRLRRTHAFPPRGGGSAARRMAEGQAGVPARVRGRRRRGWLDHGRHRGLRPGAQGARHRRDRLLVGRPGGLGDRRSRQAQLGLPGALCRARAPRGGHHVDGGRTDHRSVPRRIHSAEGSGRPDRHRSRGARQSVLAADGGDRARSHSFRRHGRLARAIRLVAQAPRAVDGADPRRRGGSARLVGLSPGSIVPLAPAFVDGWIRGQAPV